MVVGLAGLAHFLWTTPTGWAGQGWSSTRPGKARRHYLAVTYRCCSFLSFSYFVILRGVKVTLVVSTGKGAARRSSRRLSVDKEMYDIDGDSRRRESVYDQRDRRHTEDGAMAKTIYLPGSGRHQTVRKCFASLKHHAPCDRRGESERKMAKEEETKKRHDEKGNKIAFALPSQPGKPVNVASSSRPSSHLACTSAYHTDKTDRCSLVVTTISFYELYYYGVLNASRLTVHNEDEEVLHTRQTSCMTALSQHDGRQHARVFLRLGLAPTRQARSPTT
ncbi:hypothetical protein MGYG_01815 [Nannizzia gypsea CBS 118893]|uniref:Uncharacterized protein n=1 Tax=Arthroderma gypseum (strain ATCC MYA-4604 / CBS 118893) TaxID=535722 RepID=E5R3K0_ARTGP|nr:hypothetical protein MGYG_01815 [Nannizzia gypsea CBS 118893]EFQ98799.1 hypothetical protein MGYG_01815 [Nannizzia gypsea CBS 118893]